MTNWNWRFAVWFGQWPFSDGGFSMRRLGLCGALLAVIVPGLAHGQVGLAWKWKKDDEFYVRTETKVKQTLVVEDPRGDVPAPPAALGAVLGGPALAHPKVNEVGKAIGRNTFNDREVRQAFVHTTLLRYKVRKVNEDGSAEVVQTLLKASTAAPKDPAKKDEPERPKNDDLLGPVGSTPGAELVLHVTPAGEVTRVEGQEELLKKLAGTDTGKRQAIRDALSEESLKRALTHALGFLPGEKVKAGASWKRSADLNLGALGRVEVEHRYTCEGKGADENKGLEQIERTTRLVDFDPDPLRVWPSQVPLGVAVGGVATAAVRPRPQFRVTEGHFSVAEGKGTFFFDAEKGQLVRASTSMKLEGKLTIRHSFDRIYRTRLVQEQTTQTTVMDKPPEK